jgi:Calx-beta domain
VHPLNFAAFLIGLVLTMLVQFAGAATVVVDDGSDTLHSPGCATTGLSPCSLRDAITFTNTTPPSTINFGIAGGGVHTITPLSALPAVAAQTTINGYSQPGAAVNTASIQNGTNAVLMIELNLSTNGGSGLILSGNNAIAQGLVINRSPGVGVTVSGNNVQVTGNFIGTNPAGTAAGPGNAGDGVAVGGQNDFIGGNSNAARNLISGNGATGVRVSGGGSFAATLGANLVGTNAGGTAAIANNGQGIVLAGGSNHSVGVGFSLNAQGNVISGNVSDGILVTSAVSGDIIAGNNIGANAAGTAPLGNGGNGVNVNASTFVTVGFGNDPSQVNVIGGNASNGIVVGGSNNDIEGNKVGLLPNGGANPNVLAGISVQSFANQNTIGTASNGNTVTNNGGNGIEVVGAGVTGGTRNSITSNLIFGNGGLGIKLGNPPNTPTPNDAGDADTGPNTLQNYPVITAASIAGATLTVSGTLNSTGNDDFNVQVFSNAACDPSGNGEGQTLLGSTTVTSNGSGNATFGPLALAIPAGQSFITTTATNSQGNSSEFSACFTAGGAPPLPTVSINNVSANEGNSGTTPFVFTVSLSAPSAATVTVNFATADGTATSGSDYTAASGIVTFAPGQTTQTITVNVLGDTVVEPNETFVVNLSTPTNAAIAVAQGTGTIVNDDSPAVPTITINDVTQAEGNSGTTNFVFTVTISATANATVNFATADGTATAGSDYVAGSGTVTFTSGGSLTQTIVVAVLGDTVVEPNETFVVNLSGATGATIGRAQGVGTIINDDAAANPVAPIPTLDPAALLVLIVLLALAGGLAQRRMRKR